MNCDLWNFKKLFARSRSGSTCILYDFYRALWSEGMKKSRLIDLRLPMGFHLSSDFLNEIAARNHKLEHLTLSTPCRKITTDPYENPFGQFKRLSSLSLWRGVASHGHMARDENPEPEGHQPLDAVLNSLQMQLKSLELGGLADPEIKRLFPRVLKVIEGRVHLFPRNLQVMEGLVHLSIDFLVTYNYVECCLYHCKSLKTLRLERLTRFNDDPEEMMIKRPEDLPPRLRSVSLGFEDPDLVCGAAF